MSLSRRILDNLRNIPGWRTNRKIVVFESDDWGSIRMSSKESRIELEKLGFNFNAQDFNLVDALESNNDMSSLFEVLASYKDASNRNPVFTAVSIVANPNFERIKKDNFLVYHWESVKDTLNRYPNHNKVIELYQEGIRKRLFVPVFHGREHVNVRRWLKYLQSGEEAVLLAFNQGVTGISKRLDGSPLEHMQAAFDIDKPSDLKGMGAIIEEGLREFHELFGYRSKYFVPTNGPFNNTLSEVLKREGIHYLYGERVQNEPLGDNKYKRHLHYIGQRNPLDQIYLTRNGFFEPSISSQGFDINPVERCLRNIEDAFRWNKPAIISTHRLNYIGYIDPKNREKNLKLLGILLSRITSRWSDVEFLTSVELGEVIAQEKINFLHY